MRRYQLTIAGKSFEVEIQSVAGGQARVLVNGRPFEVSFRTQAEGPRVSPPGSPASPAPSLPRPAPPKPPSPTAR